MRTRKKTSHPLEDFFDIEANTTEVDVIDVLPKDIVPFEEDSIEVIKSSDDIYDEKEIAIDNQLQHLYNTSLELVQNTLLSMGGVEGKYKADMSSNLVGLLNVALGTVKEKRELKKQKDKTVAKPSGPKIQNNTLIVDNHSGLLDKLRELK